MIRKFVVAMSVMAACGLAVGCGGSSGSTADKLKDIKEKVTEGTKEAADKAKEVVVKPMVDMYPKIEEKIKGLSGDAAKVAGEKFDSFKKLVEEFKTSDKWVSLKDDLLAKFEELKKAVGL